MKRAQTMRLAVAPGNLPSAFLLRIFVCLPNDFVMQFLYVCANKSKDRRSLGGEAVFLTCIAGSL